MVVTICGSAWDGPSLPRFRLGWLVLLCFHVQGWALVYQCPECHSRCNTNRLEQVTGCSENLDPFWMGLVMTFNPATLNIEISATGQDENLIYLFIYLK